VSTPWFKGSHNLIIIIIIMIIVIKIIIITVISIAPHLTDKGEHSALYKLNNNVYIKTSKIMNYLDSHNAVCLTRRSTFANL